MKPRLFLLPASVLTSVFALTLQAQVSAPNSPPPAPPTSSATITMGNGDKSPASPDSANLRTSEQLEILLGPIALYPDPLIALILPASTNASDIVLASRFLNSGADSSQLDAQQWDESVKSLSRYPEVVTWMDENLEWTKQLGEAFATQPADVMNSVQRLRTQARAAGSLVDTPQQQVVTQNDAISIYPTQPDVIYVPTYDPEIVYVSGGRYGYGYPFLTFGLSYAIGPWLDFDCDWGQRRIWVDRSYHSGPGRDWRRPSDYPRGPVFNNDVNRHVWTPSPNRARPFPPSYGGPRHDVVRPNPFNGGPNRANDRFSANRDGRDTNRSGGNIPNSARPVSDGRNHVPTRNRDNQPHIENPALNPNVSPSASSASVSTRSPGNRDRSSAIAAPGSSAPNVDGRFNGERANRGDDQNGVHSNYRAGSIERPRYSPPPAPGIPQDRSASSGRSGSPGRTAPAPVVRSAPEPASSAPTNESSGAAPQQSGPRGGGGSMQMHER